MGKSKDQKNYEVKAAQSEAQATAAVNRLNEGSPEYKSYAERIASRRRAITDGNILGAPDFIGNSAGLAEQNRMMDANFNANPTGTMAIGRAFANPNQISAQTGLLKARQAQAAAGNLESNWKDYVSQTQAAENDLVARRDGIDKTILGDGRNASYNFNQMAQQIASQRQNMWAGLASAGLGGLGSIMRYQTPQKNMGIPTASIYHEAGHSIRPVSI